MEDTLKETITNDNVQEIELNKVETKSNTSKRTKSLTKECDVLVYNEKTHTAIISFDGFGYELKSVKENPGKVILVKYSGNVHSPNFKIEAKK